MKIKELREKSIEELKKRLLSFKKELFNLRFQKVYGKVEKTHRVKQVRRSVAQIKTLLNEMSASVMNKENKGKQNA